MKRLVRSLLRPLHTLYHSRYALRYSHAKKLFAFDLSLLLSTLVIAASGIFLTLYTPHEKRLLLVEVGAPVARVASGAGLEIPITLSNPGREDIQDLSLILTLPSNFTITRIIEDGADKEYTSTTIALHPTTKFKTHTLLAQGTLLGIPETAVRFGVHATGFLPKAHRTEWSSAFLILTPRGSVIEGAFNGSQSLLVLGETPLQISVKNTSQISPFTIQIPLTFSPLVRFRATSSTIGTITKDVWTITLGPNQTATTTGNIRTLKAQTTPLTLSFTPSLVTPNGNISQNTIKKSFPLLRASLDLTGSIADTVIIPGQITKLTLQLTNSGQEPIENTTITMTLPEGRVTHTGVGSIRGNTLTITKVHTPILGSIPPGKTITLVVPLTVGFGGQGKTNELRLISVARGTPKALQQGQVESKEVAIVAPLQTALTLNGDIIYFTREGDQLGRGPLPPQVGKETTFWGTITVQNTTGEASEVVLELTPSPNTRFTGNQSVSRGIPPTVPQGQNPLRWSIGPLEPFEAVELHIELGFTPQSIQKNWPLLTNILVTGQDVTLSTRIQNSLKALSTP